jgi:putative transposase
MKQSQIEAPDRIQPLLPMEMGYVEGVFHDSVSHETTARFAALDNAPGQVLTRRNPHLHDKYLQLFKEEDINVLFKNI